MEEDKPKYMAICAEKDRMMNKQIKKVVKKAKGDEKTFKKMRAAFLKEKVWSQNTTINVGFMNTFDPESIPRTSTLKMKKTVDSNGVAIKLDPLQEQADTMSVRDAIIYVVLKRFNDIVYPEYKPASVEIDPNHVPKPLVNINFNFFDPKDPSRKTLFNPNLADIRIDFDPEGGAWSLLGNDALTEDKKVQTMNFAWFDVGTVLHEFCHSLSMVHEHSNPNGKPINWAVCHVTQWANSTQGWDATTIKENIIEKYKVDQINGSEFDPQSIMLYFFPGKIVCKDAQDNKVPDITVADVQKCFDGCPTNKDGITACHTERDDCNMPGKGTTQNMRFSPWDVLFLNNTYTPNDQKDSSENFTVAYFQNEFSEQINPEELSRQLKLSTQRNNSQHSATTTTETTGEVPKSKSMAHAVKPDFSDLTEGISTELKFYILFVVLLTIVFLTTHNCNHRYVNYGFIILTVLILSVKIIPNINEITQSFSKFISTNLTENVKITDINVKV